MGRPSWRLVVLDGAEPKKNLRPRNVPGPLCMTRQRVVRLRLNVQLLRRAGPWAFSMVLSGSWLSLEAMACIPFVICCSKAYLYSWRVSLGLASAVACFIHLALNKITCRHYPGYGGPPRDQSRCRDPRDERLGKLHPLMACLPLVRHCLCHYNQLQESQSDAVVVQ